MADDNEASLRLVSREGSVDVDIRVLPRSSREAIVGIHDGALKIALSAPPVDGEANAALVAFLAKSLGVPKSAVSIVRGERGRSKTIRVASCTPERIRALVR